MVPVLSESRGSPKSLNAANAAAEKAGLDADRKGGNEAN
jgi:hypothetical protein